jgi:hypothetical protein
MIQLCKYQPELAALSDEELRKRHVFARVAPRNKIDDAICEGDSKKRNGRAHRSKCQSKHSRTSIMDHEPAAPSHRSAPGRWYSVHGFHRSPTLVAFRPVRHGTDTSSPNFVHLGLLQVKSVEQVPRESNNSPARIAFPMDYHLDKTPTLLEPSKVPSTSRDENDNDAFFSLANYLSVGPSEEWNCRLQVLSHDARINDSTGGNTIPSKSRTCNGPRRPKQNRQRGAPGARRSRRPPPVVTTRRSSTIMVRQWRPPMPRERYRRPQQRPPTRPTTADGGSATASPTSVRLRHFCLFESIHPHAIFGSLRRLCHGRNAIFA